MDGREWQSPAQLLVTSFAGASGRFCIARYWQRGSDKTDTQGSAIVEKLRSTWDAVSTIAIVQENGLPGRGHRAQPK